ncbi:hypothetical protein SteCoe_7880 [Stentor coeruleus]|uniref:Receptor ligand binding region domain-containing protein n=1 Tax=Stentor coeruleus TaxID=5963 RepID=A0A1R2CLK1_9CILI|nr:hypothetical protein SteCoe_7880 [Stentor coeruleus]
MLILLLLILNISAYNIGYIGSDTANLNFLKNTFKVFSSNSKFNQYTNVLEIQKSDIKDLSLIIDDSKSEISYSLDKEFVTENKIPILILAPGENSDFIYYQDSSYKCIISTLTNTFNYLNITELGVIWSFSNKNKNIIDLLKEAWDHKVISASVGSIDDKSEISKILGKVLKSEGIQDYLFLGDKKICSTFKKAFESSYLVKTGNIAIFLDECVYQVNTTGSFILSKPQVTFSSNLTEYFYNFVEPYFSVFQESELSPFQIARKFQNIINPCVYDIVNIQNSTKVVVGKADDQTFLIETTAIFLGGKNESTRFLKPQIVISANTGFTNPPGNSNVYQNSKYQEGTYFAVEKVNRDRVFFPKYELVLYDKVDCGVSVFEANYSRDCFLKHIPHMGNAYIPTLYPLTGSVLKQLASLKIKMPFIGGVGTATLLSNKTAYPMFTRITSPSSYFATAWSKILGIYGWSNIIVFYTNDSFGNGTYDVVKKESESEGFNILNAEEDRMINVVTNSSQLPIYYDRMRRAIDTGCNLMFLPMSDPSPFFWIEGLYDVGARKGDLVVVFFSITGLDALNSTGGNYTKRAELMHGSFIVYNAAWIGEYGQNVRQEYLKYRNKAWARSFFIDAAFSAAYTINFLMNQGKFFENSTEFMIAQRNIRMVGCSGTISFDHSTNDRNLYFFNLYNFYQDSLEEWHGDAIGLISPVSTVYYTVMKEPIFAQGSIPKDMKENYLDCSFRENQIRNSNMGEGIKIGVSIGLLIIAGIITAYASKKVKYNRILPLGVRCYANFQDYLTIGFIIVESFQLIAIGPSFQAFNDFLSKVSEMISLNLSKAASFRNTTFWAIFYAMLFLAYVWLVVLGLLALRVCGCGGAIRKRLEDFKNFTIPFLSNYLFIPITVCILSILACDKAIGTHLDDSYLNYDCKLTCWRGEHIGNVAPACLLIILYIPMAILYRTLWQESNTNINVRANSSFLIVKNIAFVAIIVISKIIKDSYSLAYSFVFGIIMIGLLGYVFYIRLPFNYDRANYMLKTMYLCIIWNTIICILSNSISIFSYPWLILQILGWVAIITGGTIFMSKLPPNMLVTPQGRNIVDLFKFAFGKASYRQSTYKYIK